MMMWQMNGDTCVTVHSPVECKPQIFSSIIQWVRVVEGNTTPPPSSTPTAQTQLSHHPPPLRKGVMQAAMGSGNGAGWPYLICLLQTLTPDPIGRRNNSWKFWNSMRRRRRTSIFGLSGNEEGLHTYGVLGPWNCGTRGPECREEACHPAGRQVEPRILPDGVLCEGQDGNWSGLCKQHPHSWQQGLTATLAPTHPWQGCPWRLTDLAGHVNAFGVYPHHSLIWAGQLDQFSIFSTVIDLLNGAVVIRARHCHETNYSYINE